MSGYIEKINNMQVEVASIDELRQKIQNATTVKQMNQTRMACVKFMKSEPSILKEWQTKYWSLKNCPTCGQTRKNITQF